MENMTDDARRRILQQRLDQAKSQGIEIPRRVKCKICSLHFPNPVFDGSSIVSVVCDPCKDSIIERSVSYTHLTLPPTPYV